MVLDTLLWQIHLSDKLFTHTPKFSHLAQLYFQVSNCAYHSHLQFSLVNTFFFILSNIIAYFLILTIFLKTPYYIYIHPSHQKLTPFDKIRQKIFIFCLLSCLIILFFSSTAIESLLKIPLVYSFSFTSSNQLSYLLVTIAWLCLSNSSRLLTTLLPKNVVFQCRLMNNYSISPTLSPHLRFRTHRTNTSLPVPEMPSNILRLLLLRYPLLYPDL